MASSVRVVLRNAGNGVEYRVVARDDMARVTNKALFRHPVYGNRDMPWVAQRSYPWFDTAMRRNLPAMQRAAQDALERAAGRVAERT